MTQTSATQTVTAPTTTPTSATQTPTPAKSSNSSSTTAPASNRDQGSIIAKSGGFTISERPIRTQRYRQGV